MQRMTERNDQLQRLRRRYAGRGKAVRAGCWMSFASTMATNASMPSSCCRLGQSQTHPGFDQVRSPSMSRCRGFKPSHSTAHPCFPHPEMEMPARLLHAYSIISRGNFVAPPVSR